ncbi:MAG: BlaI/MecI/CopY family transcriptional regulator [Gemmatimonadota bacterium]
MSEPAFTDRELDIMSILWRRGRATVAEVREELSDELAYTSVLSALQTLEEKKYVDHDIEGRAYRYFPLVAVEQAGESALSRVLDKIFHGSAESLLAQLVSDRSIPSAELKRMRQMLEELEGRDRP